jgi:molybdopterin synthase sulfur carrier subunit
MRWKLFADLRDVAGDRQVDVDVAAGASVEEALDALLADRPALRERVADDDGGLAEHVNVYRNGEALAREELDTPIEPDDELALFPPVSGG